MILKIKNGNGQKEGIGHQGLRNYYQEEDEI